MEISNGGQILILIASFLWGIAYFFRKISIESTPPVIFSFLTLAISAVTIATYYRQNITHLYNVIKQNPLPLISLGIIHAIAQVCIFWALQNGNLIIVTLIERVHPLIGIILAALFLKERIATNKLYLVPLTIVCLYFLINKSIFTIDLAGTNLSGIIAIVIAALGWSSCTIITRHLVNNRDLVASDVTTIRFSIAAITLIPAIIKNRQFETIKYISMESWLILSLCAILGTALGYIMYNKALKSVNGATAGMLEFPMPLTTVLLGVTILGETLTLSQMVAATLLSWAMLKFVVDK
jgi:drug/metabolite transporter (DMT)-like permease